MDWQWWFRSKEKWPPILGRACFCHGAFELFWWVPSWNFVPFYLFYFINFFFYVISLWSSNFCIKPLFRGFDLMGFHFSFCMDGHLYSQLLGHAFEWMCNNVTRFPRFPFKIHYFIVPSVWRQCLFELNENDPITGVNWLVEWCDLTVCHLLPKNSFFSKYFSITILKFFLKKIWGSASLEECCLLKFLSMTVIKFLANGF